MDHDPDCGHHRWTVDTPEDLAMMRALFRLIPDPMTIGWLDVLKLAEAHPEIEKLNRLTKAKNVDAVDERSRKNV